MVIESGKSRNLDMPKPAIGIFPKKGFRQKQHSGRSRSPDFSKNINRDAPDSQSYIKTPIGIIPKYRNFRIWKSGKSAAPICRFSACCSPCTAFGDLTVQFFRPYSTVLCGRLPFHYIQNDFCTWRRFRSASHRRRAFRFL